MLKDSNAILSIFSGRISDIGLDAAEIFSEIAKYVHENSNCKVLWASCRMSYDYVLAQKCNADIITMSPSLAKKMVLFKKSSLEYSKDTVKGFFNDAKSSGFVF
jgi:transaldolase|tara:strand:- start:29 stop:340 length:312 start_codon:yes stop_codon:yes gene_type:complete